MEDVNGQIDARSTMIEERSYQATSAHSTYLHSVDNRLFNVDGSLRDNDRLREYLSLHELSLEQMMRSDLASFLQYSALDYLVLKDISRADQYLLLSHLYLIQMAID